MMKMLLFAGIVGLAAASSPLTAQEATKKEQLIGSWSVASLKATSGDKVSYPLGEKPAGYVTFTPTRFWLLFVDSTRKSPASPTLTDAEAVAMMKTQVAWTVSTRLASKRRRGSRLRPMLMLHPARRSLVRTG